MSALKRLRKELKAFNDDTVCKYREDIDKLRKLVGENFSIGPTDDDLRVWQVIMEAPKESAYGGCLLHLRIEFPRDFPFKPPKFKFEHRMFHPSIYKRMGQFSPYDGQFSPSTIGTEEWSPSYGVAKILTNIYEILKHENVDYLNKVGDWVFEHAANKEASALFRKNYGKWRRDVYTLMKRLDAHISMPGWVERRRIVLFCLQSAAERTLSTTPASSKETGSASKHGSSGPGDAPSPELSAKIAKLAQEAGVTSVEDAVKFVLSYAEREKNVREAVMIPSPVGGEEEAAKTSTLSPTKRAELEVQKIGRSIAKRYRRSMSEVQRRNRPVVERTETRLQKMVGPSETAGFAFDIGGTLCKVVYFEPDTKLRRQRSDSEYEADEGLRKFILGSMTYGESGQRDKEFQFHSFTSGGTFHFIKFETRFMSNAFQIIKDRGIDRGLNGRIFATGGGAVKFEPQFRKEFGATIEKCDELEMLIQGINFLVDEIPNECFYLKDNDYRSGPQLEKVSFAMTAGSVYPCIVVNIGSGVSMMLVDAAGNFRRVGGTSVGGGTFYGLVSTLTSCKGFKEAIAMANSGDNSQVDLLVRDIYGRDYVEHGLKGDVVASSFGKLTRPEWRSTAKPSDVALSALVMISVNIAALAHLHAEAHGAKSVMFVGSFLHENPIALKTLSYYTQYASKETRKALFLEHDGYFGAVGALLRFLKFSAEQADGGDGNGFDDVAAKSNDAKKVVKRRAKTAEI